MSCLYKSFQPEFGLVLKVRTWWFRFFAYGTVQRLTRLEKAAISSLTDSSALLPPYKIPPLPHTSSSHFLSFLLFHYNKHTCNSLLNG